MSYHNSNHNSNQNKQRNYKSRPNNNRQHNTNNKPVSLADIEQNVKNIQELVDINLKNINPSFLVDNFEPVSVLRNTPLRAEFNNICKGKTETKNMEEKPQVDNMKIYLCKEEQIRDIPPILQPLFDKPKKYYIYGTPNTFSFYHSILCIMDSEYLFQGKVQKEKKLDESRTNLVYSLDENFTKFNYKSKRFKKTVIRDNLLNSKIFIPQVNHYISDYYNICLLIIDTETYLYSLVNGYDKDKEFIVMLRKNNYYQPILNSEGNNRFSSDILEKIKDILKPEFDIDTTEKVVKEVEKDIQINNISELQKESKYLVGDLLIIARNLGIETKISGTNRNKKKSDLYQEIKNKLELTQ